MNSIMFMLLELLLLFLWIFLSIYFIRSEFLSSIVVVIVSYVFLWMHRIALPVLVSGLYIFYLIVAGEAFLNIIRLQRNEDRIKRILHDFVIGSALHISIFCLFSIFGKGGVAFSRMLSIILFAVSIVYIGVIRYSKKRVSFPCAEIPSDTELKQEKTSKIWICLALAVIGTMLLLQAGRINMGPDNDSLHYGIRSRYILDAGNGIYENLGSINKVYMYPKGIEVLALPLNTNITFGYVISFSWWMSCGILICIFYIVRRFSSRRKGIYAAAFVSVLLAILNPGISAGASAATILIQLIAIIGILDDEYVWAGIAMLFSLAFRSTAVFTTGLIFVISILYIVIKKKKTGIKHWYISLPVLTAVILITARTVLMTGVPIVMPVPAAEENGQITSGLTPVKFNHYGFYDHESDTYDRLVATGNKEIYEFLARDGRQRVLAIADQPECFGFRCNVQSYTDIDGPGGDDRFVQGIDCFREFLNNAETQYIYTNEDFLDSHGHAAEIVELMIADGSLKLIVDEGCNRLYEYVQK